MTRRASILGLLVAISCSTQHGDRLTGREAAPMPTPTPTEIPAPALAPDAPRDAAPTTDGSLLMPSDHKRGPIPQTLADRLPDLITAPLPDDVVLALADVGRVKDPSQNVRWQLTSDGRLFLVRHGGTNRSVAFDRPLPAKPTATLPPDEVATLLAAVNDAGLFDHPGYEEVPASGGTLLVIRARRGTDVHTVVLVNVRTPLTERLQAVAQRR
jgi:hypothetical protein